MGQSRFPSYLLRRNIEDYVIRSLEDIDDHDAVPVISRYNNTVSLIKLVSLKELWHTMAADNGTHSTTVLFFNRQFKHFFRRIQDRIRLERVSLDIHKRIF